MNKLLIKLKKGFLFFVLGLWIATGCFFVQDVFNESISSGVPVDEVISEKLSHISSDKFLINDANATEKLLLKGFSKVVGEVESWVGYGIQVVFFLIGVLLSLIIKVIVSMVYLFVFLLMLALKYQVSYNGFINEPPVIVGWVVVRDLANSFLILVMIMIGFGTMLNIQAYSYKQALPKLVIAAILINFSKLIAIVILDFFQVIMLSFVAAFYELWLGVWAQHFGLIDFFTAATPETNVGAAFKKANILDSIFAGITRLTGIFITGVASIVMGVVIGIVVGIFVITLGMRMVMIWLFLVLSPLPWLLDLIPRGKSYAQEWWNQYINYVILGPFIAFFLWLSTVTVSDVDKRVQGIMVQDKAVKDFNVNAEGNGFTAEGFLSDKFTGILVGMMLLVGGLQMSTKLAGVASGVIGAGVGAAKLAIKAGAVGAVAAPALVASGAASGGLAGGLKGISGAMKAQSMRRRLKKTLTPEQFAKLKKPSVIQEGLRGLKKGSATGLGKLGKLKDKGESMISKVPGGQYLLDKTGIPKQFAAAKQMFGLGPQVDKISEAAKKHSTKTDKELVRYINSTSGTGVDRNAAIQLALEREIDQDDIGEDNVRNALGSLDSAKAQDAFMKAIENSDFGAQFKLDLAEKSDVKKAGDGAYHDGRGRLRTADGKYVQKDGTFTEEEGKKAVMSKQYKMLKKTNFNELSGVDQKKFEEKQASMFEGQMAHEKFDGKDVNNSENDDFYKAARNMVGSTGDLKPLLDRLEKAGVKGKDKDEAILQVVGQLGRDETNKLVNTTARLPDSDTRKAEVQNAVVKNLDVSDIRNASPSAKNDYNKMMVNSTEKSGGLSDEEFDGRIDAMGRMQGMNEQKLGDMKKGRADLRGEEDESMKRTLGPKLAQLQKNREERARKKVDSNFENLDSEFGSFNDQVADMRKMPSINSRTQKEPLNRRQERQELQKKQSALSGANNPEMTLALAVSAKGGAIKPKDIEAGAKIENDGILHVMAKSIEKSFQDSSLSTQLNKLMKESIKAGKVSNDLAKLFKKAKATGEKVQSARAQDLTS